MTWNSEPGDPREEASQPPMNIDAEYMVFGAILFDPRAFEYLPEVLQPEHFYEPFHQRLFYTCLEMNRLGQLVDIVTLHSRFTVDAAYQELGGMLYLADIFDKAGPAQGAKDYGLVIYDCWQRRRLIQLSGEIAKSARTDLDSPAKAQIEDIERALFKMAEDKASQGLQEFAGPLQRAVENIAAAFARDGAMVGVSTGLADLDRKLGGLHPSDLLILAGRPSMGKTALATNIAFHVARTYAFDLQEDGSRKTTAGGVVAFFSLEMSGEQLSERILAEVSGIPVPRMKTGDIDQVEFGRIYDAAREIAAVPLYIDATGAISISALATRCRRLKRTVGLDLVVVDYLQLVTGDPGMSTTDRVSAAAAGLKALAKDLGVPVIALSQVSRDVEKRDDKRPQLSDLRESGAIEQDADQVVFVYREQYYLERAEPKEGSKEHMAWEEELDKVRNTAEVIIGKQRHGPIGTVRLAWNGDTTKFTNLAREDRFSRD